MRFSMPREGYWWENLGLALVVMALGTAVIADKVGGGLYRPHLERSWDVYQSCSRQALVSDAGLQTVADALEFRARCYAEQATARALSLPDIESILGKVVNPACEIASLRYIEPAAPLDRARHEYAACARERTFAAPF